MTASLTDYCIQFVESKIKILPPIEVDISSFIFSSLFEFSPQAASLGGSNIDPIAWEDKECKEESRFVALVRSHIIQLSKPFEEDALRPGITIMVPSLILCSPYLRSLRKAGI
ncbi:uncharacterized protein LOC132057267 [Lycium ferocissimum]|uniref:uncharacterized protein LOC132057267 n=1 Tax=Lycium ferocissimum TaxID=112874 RepID=UPI0028160B3B|nr:uncharacterized protein LOC132057267 [Lycium ferocissimum]